MPGTVEMLVLFSWLLLGNAVHGQTIAPLSGTATCQVAMPADCGASGEAEAGRPGPRQVQGVEATTPDECTQAARRVAARCLQTSGGKASIATLFQKGPLQTQRLLSPGRPVAAQAGPLTLPITYGKHFETERELLGYAPEFAPGPVSFGKDGLMRIRHERYLQTQLRSGAWTYIDLAAFSEQAIRKLPDVESFEWLWDNRSAASDQRIYVDGQGRSYTLIQGGRTRLKKDKAQAHRPYLLVSDDDGGTWRAVAIDLPDARPGWRARIEHNDDNNDRSGPPPVLLYDRDENDATRSSSLFLYLPRWRQTELTVPPPLKLSENSLLQENHSGAGNSVVSTRDRVFVVYPGSRQVDGRPGTPAYFVSVDRATGTMLPETLLGQGGAANKVDNHNIPAICIGTGGSLHVMLPGHQEALSTVTGQMKGATIDWQAPVQIGQGASTAGGYTYASLNCDRKGHVYVTSRWSGDQYRFKLVLLHRLPDRQWLSWNGNTHRVLVDPARSFYAVWHQKVSLGSGGELFLAYSYYANQLAADELEALKFKLPFEDWSAVKLGTPSFCVKGTDPRCWRHPMPDVNQGVLLRSTDGGERWTFVR